MHLRVSLLKNVKWRYRISIYALVLTLIIYFFLQQTNAFIRPQLIAVAKEKANESLNILVQESIEQIEYDAEQLIKYEYSDDKIKSIYYDTNYLNQILSDSVDTIDDVLDKAYQGEEVGVLNEVFYDDGIVYSVPIGYLSGITFLQNYGPTIDISLRLSSFVDSKIRVEQEPFGLNSTIVSVYLDVSLYVTILTSIYQEDIVFDTSLPLIIQVVAMEVSYFETNNKTE